MGDSCPGPGRGQSGAAGVSEEVENLDLGLGTGGLALADELREPVPVGRLLREEAGVFKGEGLDAKGQLPGSGELIGDLPFLRQVKELPFAAAPSGAVIVGVEPVPVRIPAGCVPDNLRVRAKQGVAAPALQLLPPGAVVYFVVFPAICQPHRHFPPLFFPLNMKYDCCRSDMIAAAGAICLSDKISDPVLIPVAESAECMRPYKTVRV